MRQSPGDQQSTADPAQCRSQGRMGSPVAFEEAEDREELPCRTGLVLTPAATRRSYSAQNPSDDAEGPEVPRDFE